jgi:prepilin-type N-terminal cleavage/methylation domain-containing protein
MIINGKRLLDLQFSKYKTAFMSSIGRYKNYMSNKLMCKLKGFTLIELLVVIAIIMLLMAILLPAIQRARNQSRAVICQTKLKQWGAAFFMYIEESQGRFPFGTISRILFLRGSYLRKDDPNIPPFYHDFNTGDIACCPMAVKPGYRNARFSHRHNTYIIRGVSGSTFEAWHLTSPSPPFSCSYGMNSPFSPSTVFSWGPVSRELGPCIYSLKNRSNIPILLDSTAYSGGLGEDPPNSGGWGVCINRHNGFVNSLFLDWTVRKIGLKELWTLKWSDDFDTAGPWTKAGGVQPEDWPQWMRAFKDY